MDIFNQYFYLKKVFDWDANIEDRNLPLFPVARLWEMVADPLILDGEYIILASLKITWLLVDDPRSFGIYSRESALSHLF